MPSLEPRPLAAAALSAAFAAFAALSTRSGPLLQGLQQLGQLGFQLLRRVADASTDKPAFERYCTFLEKSARTGCQYCPAHSVVSVGLLDRTRLRTAVRFCLHWRGCLHFHLRLCARRVHRRWCFLSARHLHRCVRLLCPLVIALLRQVPRSAVIWTLH